MTIKKGYFYYIETKLYLENNAFNLAKVLDVGLKNNNIKFIDAELFYNLEKKEHLSIEQIVQILNKDLSETSFIICVFKDSNFSIWIDKNSKNLHITFSFLDENLIERKYLPDNAQDIDIFTYLNLIMQWLESFEIKQLHVEFSKP